MARARAISRMTKSMGGLWQIFCCLGNLGELSVLGAVAVWTEGGCRGEGLTTGVVRHACRHRVTARGVFGFVGGRCCRLEVRAVARGRSLGQHGSGQRAPPPQERWHEGGWFLFFSWGLLRCRRGIAGAGGTEEGFGGLRMPGRPREWSAGTRGLGGGVFDWGLQRWGDHGSGHAAHVPHARERPDACRRGSGSTRGFFFLSGGMEV